MADNIMDRLEALGMTAREASMKTGRGPDVIRNVLRAAEKGYNYNPRADTMALIAQVLDTTPEWLLGPSHYDEEERAQLAAKRSLQPKPLPQLVGEANLKVFAAVEGGPGEMVVNTDPIEIVARPWFLERVPEAFGVVVTGESMVPVYDPNDVVLVNPKLGCIKGKDAIFVGGEHEGDFKASLKRYMGSTESHWIAHQFSPPDGQSNEIRFDRKIWQKALRVVGKYTR